MIGTMYTIVVCDWADGRRISGITVRSAKREDERAREHEEEHRSRHVAEGRRGEA
jgi:hypothetical protein